MSIWGESMWIAELARWLQARYQVTKTAALTVDQATDAAHALESRLADLQLASQESAQGAMPV